MQVMICGGLKSKNIVDSLEKKLQADGVSFLIVQNIDDIDKVYARGERFDRALITEQSWTNDLTNVEEAHCREKLARFTEMTVEKDYWGVQYVFLTASNDMASIIFEETNTLSSNSIICVEKPPYKANFFLGLVSSDFETFPGDIVYKPEPLMAKREEATDIGVGELNLESIGGMDFSGTIREQTEDYDEASEGTNELSEAEACCDDTFEDSDEKIEDIFESDVFDENNEGTEIQSGENILEQIGSNAPTDLFGNMEDFDAFEDEPTGNGDDGFWPEPVSFEAAMPDNQHRDNVIGFSRQQQEMETDKEKHDGAEYEKPKATHDFDEDIYRTPASSGASLVEAYCDVESDENEAEEPVELEQNKKSRLESLAIKGCSIAIMGCGGSGCSTTVYGVANSLNKQGYSVLIVDMDTLGRSQSYMTKQARDTVTSGDTSLTQAFNATSNALGHVNILKPKLHLLGMGMAEDVANMERSVEGMKAVKFHSTAKNAYDFVIYDMPFDKATKEFKLITMSCDYVATVVDCSNWGITKYMLMMCNIDSPEVREFMFNSSHMILNKLLKLEALMGRKLRSLGNIGRYIDDMVKNLVSGIEYRFEDIPVSYNMPFKIEMENSWYNARHWSDTKDGYKAYYEMVKAMLEK